MLLGYDSKINYLVYFKVEKTIYEIVYLYK